MVGIDGKGIRANFNKTHYDIKIDSNDGNNNKDTGYTTKFLRTKKDHKDNFLKLDAQLKGKSEAEIKKILEEIAHDDKEITKAELETYLNRPTSSSNLDAIKNQANANRTIENAPDSLYKTMIARDVSKKADDVKKDLKDLFKTGKASYSKVEEYLTKTLKWTKESVAALFFNYSKDNKDIKLSEFLFAVDVYVRDFNENVCGKMPGFESEKYFQKYTKFNITREHEVNQVFDAAFNSNDPDVKQCREDIAKSYAKTYTSSELSLSTNWTAEMKQSFYIKLAETASAKVPYTIEDQPASGKKKATTKTVAGFYKVDHNKLLEKYFKELLEQKQAEEKKTEDATADASKRAPSLASKKIAELKGKNQYNGNDIVAWNGIYFATKTDDIFICYAVYNNGTVQVSQNYEYKDKKIVKKTSESIAVSTPDAVKVDVTAESIEILAVKK